MRGEGFEKSVIIKDGKPVQIFHKNRAKLLERLQEVQKKEGFISDDKMQKVANEFNIHPVEVYAVVSFYSFLSTKKMGRNVIRISDCISSVMRGSKTIVKAFERKLGIKCGQTTYDGKFTLLKTSCIGMCDKAPAILVNENLLGPVAPEDINKIIGQLE